jgi:hypothetical protein
METEDGIVISVPENYASKSMLVMGDELVFRIAENGNTFFKQVKKAPCKKVIAIVLKDSDSKFKVVAQGEKFRVLEAAVSYHKLRDGDEVLIIIPENPPLLGDKWAAIETKTG